MDAPSPASDEAPKPSLKRLATAFVGLLQGHLELIGIEVQEEKSRTFRLFIFSSLSLFFALLVMVGLSALVIIVFWDTHRILATSLLCLFYLLGMLVCLYKVMGLVKQGEAPFHATLEELARNRERLL